MCAACGVGERRAYCQETHEFCVVLLPVHWSSSALLQPKFALKIPACSRLCTLRALKTRFGGHFWRRLRSDGWRGWAELAAAGFVKCRHLKFVRCAEDIEPLRVGWAWGEVQLEATGLALHNAATAVLGHVGAWLAADSLSHHHVSLDSCISKGSRELGSALNGGMLCLTRCHPRKANHANSDKWVPLFGQHVEVAAGALLAWTRRGSWARCEDDRQHGANQARCWGCQVARLAAQPGNEYSWIGITHSIARGTLGPCAECQAKLPSDAHPGQQKQWPHAWALHSKLVQLVQDAHSCTRMSVPRGPCLVIGVLNAAAKMPARPEPALFLAMVRNR